MCFKRASVQVRDKAPGVLRGWAPQEHRLGLLCGDNVPLGPGAQGAVERAVCVPKAPGAGWGMYTDQHLVSREIPARGQVDKPRSFLPLSARFQRVLMCFPQFERVDNGKQAKVSLCPICVRHAAHFLIEHSSMKG